MGCCFVVSQSSVAVIESWGSYSGVRQPGLHFKIPIAQKVREYVSMRIQQINVRIESKTKDNVFVHLQVAVQYLVKPEAVYEAVYRLVSPHEQIQSYVQNTVRSLVSNMTIDEVFGARETITQHVQSELEKTMSEAGFHIRNVLLVDIDPAANVKNAMNEIQTQERLRIATVTRAEAHKQEVIKNAEAESEAKHLSGMGVARQRMAIIQGLGTSIHDFHEVVDDTSSQQILQLILLTQYFDMMKDMASHSNNNTVFLPHAPGSVADLQHQLTNSFLAEQTYQGSSGYVHRAGKGKGKVKNSLDAAAAAPSSPRSS